jgi:hypothetical protein
VQIHKRLQLNIYQIGKVYYNLVVLLSLVGYKLVTLLLVVVV